MKRLLPLALLFVVLAFGVRWFSSGGERVSPADFVNRPADALVLDVRTTQEFDGGHLAGALHANVMSDFKARMDTVSRDRPLYLYCASGQRSGRAAAMLESMGFTRVYNAGGIGALVGAGAESAP
jgi:phage shock protein E